MQEVYGPAPLTLYAELTSEEIEQRIHTLKTANPQLILTTDAALRGIELSPDIVVHYDIPYRPELLELRIARFRRPGIANPVRMVALVEEASVLKNLWVKQLEIARALDE
jgi:superfamily II DNA/RNA helicase